MQIFVFVFLKKIKLKQKCLDLRRDRLNRAREPSVGAMLPNTHFSSYFKRQEGIGLPLSLHVVRNKWAWVGTGGTSVCAQEGLGGGQGSIQPFPERSYLPGPVTCTGAEDEGGWRRLGWPERSRGTDGAGLRSQGLAPLGEVELVPLVGRGGRQCLSGPDSLP